jgi:hypothetical protein
MYFGLETPAWGPPWGIYSPNYSKIGFSCSYVIRKKPRENSIDEPPVQSDFKG